MRPMLPQFSRGFTLIELLVTLVVLGVVVATALPNFASQIRNSQSVAVGEGVVSALNYARSEAVKRSGAVAVCASDDGATCSNDWSEGWMVFVDGAGPDGATPSVDEVLRVWDAPSANARVATEQDGSNTNFVRFGAMGVLVRQGEVTIDASVERCTGDSARRIVIKRGGSLRVQNWACS